MWISSAAADVTAGRVIAHPTAAPRLALCCVSSHVFGEACKSEYHFTDLDLATATGDHNYISANEKFFAVAVRGGGGPVLVQSWEQYGKVPRGAPTLCGHSSTCILHHFCILAHSAGEVWHGGALGRLAPPEILTPMGAAARRGWPSLDICRSCASLTRSLPPALLCSAPPQAMSWTLHGTRSTATCCTLPVMMAPWACGTSPRGA